MDPVLKVGQVATICQVAPRTVAKWIDSGTLAGYRVPHSKDRRIPLKGLLKFMREHQIPIPQSIDLGSPYRILLIGASALIRQKFLAAFDEVKNITVQAAPSIFSAGVLMGILHPECVLVDLAIGEIETSQIIQSIRESPDHKDTLLVGLSPRDYPGLRALGFDETFTLLDQTVPWIALKIQQNVAAKRNNSPLLRRRNCQHPKPYSPTC